MFIYSRTIVKFIAEIRSEIERILSREIGLKTRGNRFYDRPLKNSYPVKIVIFNDKSMLGYFDSEFLELGFHERLMHCDKKKLLCVIRHELAHYMVSIHYGNDVQAHGVEFKTFCMQTGWGEEVYRATLCLENSEESLVRTEKNAIVGKIRKLMALATSSNEHEAELAMIKSRELLLKHRIDSGSIEDDDAEKIILKRLMRQKKVTGKMRAISHILETFFVNVVYNKTGKFTCIEILGNSVNVEIAEYVADFLDRELDLLWDRTRTDTGLKGTVAKNSFFIGVSLGYCKKVSALKREYDKNMTAALLVIENRLVDARAMVYPKLSDATSKRKHCPHSSALGEQTGNRLNIRPAVRNSSESSPLLIAF